MAIKADIAGLNSELDRLNATIARYVDELGVNVSRVVEHQSSLFQRDIVNKAPPQDQKATRAKIKKDVESKFLLLGEGGSVKSRHLYSGYNNSESGGKHGSGEIYWYAWTSSGIYGVGKDNDMRKASPDDIYSLYRKTSPKGRIKLGTRGSQGVFIWQKILTRKSQVNAVVARIVSHIGRLKASFAVAWHAGVCVPARGNLPQYVRRHLDEGKAKGSFVNGLKEVGFPTFTFISDAAGASSSGNVKIIKESLAMRGRMATKHIENLVRLQKQGKWTPDDL